MTRLCILSVICFTVLFAERQTPTAMPQVRKQPRVMAHDSVTVSAGIPREQLANEALYDDTFTAAMNLKASTDYEGALDKFMEAEALTSKLGERATAALQATLEQEGDCLAVLRRFPEAEAVYKRRIDVLRAWTNEYDGAYAHNFVELAAVRMLKQDWAGAERYCMQGMGAYDKVIAHFTSSDTAQAAKNAERRAKALDMYYLALIYYREGRTGDSLNTFDQAFNTALELHASHQSLQTMGTSARNVALVTWHPIWAIAWQARLVSLSRQTVNGKP